MKKNLLLSVLCVGLIVLASNVQALPIAGSSTGTFINPTGPSGMVTTGTGTNNFTWGAASPPSRLQFTGTAFNTTTETLFSFGTLTYFNGTIPSGTEANTVDLSVGLSFTTPSGINESFIYDLQLINTPNTSDPNASADYVNFPNSIPDQYFSYAGVNYTLEFLGFDSIIGSGFAGISSFHVLEGFSASAELVGKVTSEFTPVPEPSSILLLGLGLLGIGRYARRKF